MGCGIIQAPFEASNMSLVFAEIGLNQFRITGQDFCFAMGADSAQLDDITIIGYFQRLCSILLNDDDGRPFFLDFLD